ncbi:MAG TPA: hypothetical protein VKR56_06940 [Candidatus Cybelea sp.]|nr:hypothetical protein [Candidatus Cybelea sp.]
MANAPPTASALENWGKLLALVRDGVFVCAVYLYFTGFTYRYYYYQHFGLRNIISDPTPYTAFVLSYTVFAGNWPFFVSAAAVLCVIVVVASRLLSPKIGHRLTAFVVIAAAVALFPCLNKFSFESAQKDALALEQRALIGRDARLDINSPSPKSYNQSFIDAANGYALHVLARDDKNTYALWQPVLRQNNTGGVVFVIPNADVRHIEILTEGN